MKFIIVLGGVGQNPPWICVSLIIPAPPKCTPNVRLCSSVTTSKPSAQISFTSMEIWYLHSLRNL